MLRHGEGREVRAGWGRLRLPPGQAKQPRCEDVYIMQDAVRKGRTSKAPHGAKGNTTTYQYTIPYEPYEEETQDNNGKVRKARQERTGQVM